MKCCYEIQKEQQRVWGPHRERLTANQQRRRPQNISKTHRLVATTGKKTVSDTAGDDSRAVLISAVRQANKVTTNEIQRCCWLTYRWSNVTCAATNHFVWELEAIWQRPGGSSKMQFILNRATTNTDNWTLHGYFASNQAGLQRKIHLKSRYLFI